MLRDIDASGDLINEKRVIDGMFCMSLVFLYLFSVFPRDMRRDTGSPFKQHVTA